MKKTKLAVAFLTLINLGLPTSFVSAQTGTTGISVGDTFRYTYAFDVTVDSANFSFPTMFEDLFEQAKSIEWAQIAIKDISGPEVTAQTLLHFKNETEQSTTTTTNVETGIGDLGLFVVRSNLNQNDLLYVGDDSAVINETTIKTYSTSSRQVNHQSITSEYNISDDEAADLNMTGFQQTNSQDIFWDRQLGVLVEMSFNMKTRSQTVNADMSLSVKLVETNVFSIPEFPTWTLVFIAFTMTALVAILYKKKNGPLFPECVEYKKS